MKIEIKYTKNVNVLNQNVNMTKQARLATFTVKYCKTIYGYCSRINGTQLKHDCRDSSSTHQTDHILRPFLTFSSSVTEKNWPLLRGYFGILVHVEVGVTIAERWPLLEVHQ